MAHVDFSTLDGLPQWRQALLSLIMAAEAASQPASTAAARAEACQDLEEFRDFPPPFPALQRYAVVAINDTLLADINQALRNLQDLARQLQEESLQQSHLVGLAPPPQLPRLALLRLLTTIGDLRAHYPTKQRALHKQLDALQTTVNKLLDEELP